MNETVYERDFQHLRIGALRSHGDAGTDLRGHVEARAAQLSGRKSDHREILPPPLDDFVEKVALHAYKVTDDDIHALERAGYSQDAIFELTVCIAVGAGAARFERAMEALRESKE
ncbi:MAG: hypothetical protein ACYTGZ_13070 [Planctomycetota bacterium]|jgi:hypothetical protein